MTESNFNSLVGLKLPEFKKMVVGMGIKGTSVIRRGDLIAAISGGVSVPARSEHPIRTSHPRKTVDAESQLPVGVPECPAPEPSEVEKADPGSPAQQSQPWAEDEDLGRNRRRRERNKERDRAIQEATNEEVRERLAAALGQTSTPNTALILTPTSVGAGRFGEDNEGGRRGRRRHNRDRQNHRNHGSGGMNRFENEPMVSEDDMLTAVSGVVDILDNYAFVRTTGYLPGPNGVYLSLATVRRFGLRRGDVTVDATRTPREGERKEKYNSLVRVDSVNGDDPEKAKQRPEFVKLTPLYPQEKLRLETVNTRLTGRVIDPVAPIGKGQRGLVVSPPKAGKAMVAQTITNAIAASNPEVHLMVVLVGGRPEEVTDFQCIISGEVIASTFDRPAKDRTVVTELAIEYAKRLVRLDHDVVVLLNGTTHLGKAYNLAISASGRTPSGDVDSAALYPPKKFFGAARNIENGGSLTILVTALIGTESRMNEVTFKEFKGTSNMGPRLAKQLADRRIFPAIDVDISGTRRKDLSLGHDELNIIWKLQRAFSGLDNQAALETLLARMRKAQDSREFLPSVLKTTPAQDG